MNYYLNAKQNIKAASVFLNVFNLKLENKKNINRYLHLKIYAGEKPVGVLTYQEGKILMNAKINDYILEANYEIPLISGAKNAHNTYFLSSSWCTKINYKLYQQENNYIEGTFDLGCLHSAYDNNHIIYQSSFHLINDKKQVLNVNINKHSLLALEANRNDTSDTIIINPERTKFFVHIHNKLDKKNYEREYIEITNDEELNPNHVFYYKEYNNIKLDEVDKDLPHTNAFDEDKNFTKGRLIHKLSPQTFPLITSINTYLKENYMNILSNFIALSLNNYSSEDIINLLGINDSNFANYDAYNLNDLYFDNDFETVKTRNLKMH